MEGRVREKEKTMDPDELFLTGDSVDSSEFAQNAPMSDDPFCLSPLFDLPLSDDSTGSGAFFGSSEATAVAPSPRAMLELDCSYCKEDISCGCAGSKLEAALRVWPSCGKCHPVPCNCLVRIERVGLQNKRNKDSSPKAVPLSAPLYWVEIPPTAGGDEGGVPLRSFPDVLARKFLQTSGVAVKQFGTDVVATIRKLDRFADIVKVQDTSLVKFKHSDANGEHYERVRLNAEEIAADLRDVMTKSFPQQQKRESYGKLARFFQSIGEIFLTLFCEEFKCGKFRDGSNMEEALKLAIAVFFGVEYKCKICRPSQQRVVGEIDKCEMCDYVTRVFAEIENGCRESNAEYGAKSDAYRKSGDTLLAILLKQLSCFEKQMYPARKAFILRFSKEVSRKDWKDPSVLLENAMKEARDGPTMMAVAAVQPSYDFAEPLRPMVDRGILKEHDDRKYGLIQLEVLEAIAIQLGPKKLESVLNKRIKRGDQCADLAYLLRPATDELLESGDVVYVVYGEDGSLTCTKRKPLDQSTIFGRSVVAGAGNLKPYMVASPHGVSEASGVKVVYLGHAFVKVEHSECDKIKPGTWLCASNNGYAVPGDDKTLSHLRVGKAIGRPVLDNNNKWLVEAFVFIGQGEDDMALAELSTQVKTLDVRIGNAESFVEEVKDGQMFLDIAIGNLEKEIMHLKDKQKDTTEQVNENSRRQDTSDVRVGQVEDGLLEVKSEQEQMRQSIEEGNAREDGRNTGPNIDIQGAEINEGVALNDQFNNIPRDYNLAQLPSPLEHNGGNLRVRYSKVNAPIANRQFNFKKK
jgi:hypothetical protein